MESSLPFAFRVAAGLVAETLSVVRRLPTEISTLPVTVIGQVAKLSFQLNQQLTELATEGDHLLASLQSEKPPPERTAWSTIDDDDAPAPTDGLDDAVDAAADDAPRAAEPPMPMPDAVIDDDLPGVISTTETLDHPLIEDLASLELVEEAVADSSAGAAEPPSEPGTPRLRAVPKSRSGLDISGLTVAQLRSRMRSMSADQVRTALQQEEGGSARPAILTVLTNRLATLARSVE